MEKVSCNHEDFFSDDGIFAVKERTVYEYSERCCQCGYELLPGEEAMALNNGDLIHESCWNDYAEENAAFFGNKFIYSDGSEV